MRKILLAIWIAVLFVLCIAVSGYMIGIGEYKMSFMYALGALAFCRLEQMNLRTNPDG
jgi:hypothetical protein